MYELMDATLDILESGKVITLKWDCGGDQAIITVFIDSEELPIGNAYGNQLEFYLMKLLDLPDAGEFALDGGGEIIDEDEKIFLVYESILKGYENYTREGENLGWLDVNEKDDTYSGKIELFTD